MAAKISRRVRWSTRWCLEHKFQCSLCPIYLRVCHKSWIKIAMHNSHGTITYTVNTHNKVQPFLGPFQVGTGPLVWCHPMNEIQCSYPLQDMLMSLFFGRSPHSPQLRSNLIGCTAWHHQITKFYPILGSYKSTIIKFWDHRCPRAIA